MDSPPFDPRSLAARMLADFDRREPGSAFADGLRLSVADAYRLQTDVARLREARGEAVVGYKIGCVCRENQHANGLSHPVFGRLWSTEQHADGVTLRLDEYANLAVEGELAVSLDRDLDPSDSSLTQIAAAVDCVYPVVELHHLVLHSEPRGAELIASNAIHAGVVRGAGMRPPPTGSPTTLTLAFDGQAVDSWSDRRWPDDILGAVPWLLDELEQRGQGLRRGQLLLVGAWGPPRPVSRPDAPVVGRVDVTSSNFGAVSASLV